MGDPRLGRPTAAVCHTLWFRPDAYFAVPWRGRLDVEGGGPTMGHGIHQFDLLLSILGEWDAVVAVAARQAKPTATEDLSCAIVTFANGAVATVVNSVRVAARVELPAVRLRARDRRAGPRLRLRRRRLDGHARRRATRRRSPTRGPPGRRACRSGHDAQFAAVLDALDAGTPPPVPLAETRRTVELIAAIYASAFTGRRVARGELGTGLAVLPPDGRDGGAVELSAGAGSLRVTHDGRRAGAVRVRAVGRAAWSRPGRTSIHFGHSRATWCRCTGRTTTCGTRASRGRCPTSPARVARQLLGRADLPAGPGLRAAGEQRRDAAPLVRLGDAGRGDRGAGRGTPSRASAGSPESRTLSFAVHGAAWTLGFATTFTNVTESVLVLGSPTTEGRPNAGYGGLFWRGPRSFTGGAGARAGRVRRRRADGRARAVAGVPRPARRARPFLDAAVHRGVRRRAGSSARPRSRRCARPRSSTRRSRWPRARP